MPEAKENKVKFGISNVHIAKLNESDTGITYGTPFKLPGARNLTTDPEGEIVKWKADDITYFSSTSNNGYTGDLEVALLNKQFLTDILGMVVDANGALFESSDDQISRFAIMFEIKGDVKKRRVVFYDCTTNRPSAENSTVEETIEPQTDTVGLSMNPRSTDHLIKSIIEPSETNTEVYESFFDEVYERAV